MSSNLSLTELIDTEVLKSKGQYFRNREIVQATGASRAHVSQRLKYLWDEGIVEKNDRDWFVADNARLITLLMKTAKSLELHSSKFLSVSASRMTLGVEAIQLINSIPRTEWDKDAAKLEQAMVEEIDVALDTLRNLKRMIAKPPKSDKQIFRHMAASPGYAEDLQKSFVAMVKNFTGDEVEYETYLTDILRPEAEEKFNA